LVVSSCQAPGKESDKPKDPDTDINSPDTAVVEEGQPKGSSGNDGLGSGGKAAFAFIFIFLIGGGVYYACSGKKNKSPTVMTDNNGTQDDEGNFQNGTQDDGPFEDAVIT
jgi:hypothetical protein